MRRTFLFAIIMVALSVKIYAQIDSKYLSLIGYKDGIPMFSDFNIESDIYKFDGSFEFMYRGMKDYYPIFINDNITVWINGSKTIRYQMNNEQHEVTLPFIPSWIISDPEARNLYYTSGDKEYENLKSYNIDNSSHNILPLIVSNEKFWFSNTKFYYSVEDSFYNNTLFATEDFKTCDTIFSSDKVAFYSIISPDDGYIISKLRDNADTTKVFAVNLLSGDKKIDYIPSMSYFLFLYDDDVYFYKPSKIDVYRSKIEVK